jgi:hypothetical protein
MDNVHWQGRLEACSTCSKHTGIEGAATVNKAPNAIGNGAKRQMNTVKFWLEPALSIGQYIFRNTSIRKLLAKIVKMILI